MTQLERYDEHDTNKQADVRMHIWMETESIPWPININTRSKRAASQGAPKTLNPICALEEKKKEGLDHVH